MIGSSDTKNNRIHWIDRMRGIAILSVVIQHVTYSFDNDFMYHKLIAISNMGVFFFISGFIMNETYNVSTINDLLSFLGKKARQLLLPLLVWCLVVNRYFFSDFTSWELISIIDLYDFWEKPALWFLLTLFGYSIWYALFKMIAHRHGGGTFQVLYWLVLNVAFMALWMATGEFANLTLYMPSFAVGVLISNLYFIEILKRRWIIDLSMIAIFLLSASWYSGQTTIQNIVLKLIVTMSVICVLYNICLMNWSQYIDRFITKCGIYSLAIYCAHWPFNMITDITFGNPVIVQNELIALGVTLMVAVASCSLCILFKQIVSKAPLIDLLLFGAIKKETRP